MVLRLLLSGILPCLFTAPGTTLQWQDRLTACGGPVLADTLENFDSGQVTLISFPGEDLQPDSWRLDSIITYRNSPYSLRLFGNTWKIEPVTPIRLDSSKVWQVALYVESLGEIHGFGLAGTNETLLYSLAGAEQLDPWRWLTVYQGAFPVRQWNIYQLSVGQDWLSRFGNCGIATALIFINDRDAGPRAISYFDEILDITADQPIAPTVEAWYETLNTTLQSVTVRFHSRITDPDSPEHQYFWSFGDGSTSRDSSPVHTYNVRDNHNYTALLEVEDSTRRRGRAACRVRVDPGPGTLPVKMNFVGDIMLARRYENPGGIIDTIGPEGVFDSILSWLGRAADITVANLESPLTANGTRHPTKPIVFRGRPSNVRGLTHAGIDVVSLANNHVIDYGLAGMCEMQESLAGRSILFGGAGADLNEACQPVFTSCRGISIAFICASDRNGQYDNYQPYLDAGLNKPGFAMLDTYHLRRQLDAVRQTADLIVCVLHTGEEYSKSPAWEESGDEWFAVGARYPAPGDTAERHRAVSAGADLVVCHHPHVLQGFEVYQGKLIAHSLGNFTFDLEYPETYPTAILNAEIERCNPATEELAFSRYTVLPAYIDDYIPRRARGELGLHILDDLAQRSRELGTFLAVDRESVYSEVLLDTLSLAPVVVRDSIRTRLRLSNNWWASSPLRLPRRGSVSALLSMAPSGEWQYRLGREILWVGNFEDEGASLWLLNQPDESYDTIALHGRRSLRQRRTSGAPLIITNLEERMVCYADSLPHTLFGSIRTENAESAGVVIKFYTARSGGGLIGAGDLGVRVSGTHDWACYDREFTPPRNAFFDVELQSRGPDSGIGRSWFDNVGVISWEEWQPLIAPAAIRTPNDYYWLQVRAPVQITEAILIYEETDYSPQVGIGQDAGHMMAVPALHVWPNPVRKHLFLEYNLDQPCWARVRIFDVSGRQLKVLMTGPQPAGRKVLEWDRTDQRGAILPAGAYLLMLETPGGCRSSRVILTK